MRPGLGHATGIFPNASAGDLKGRMPHSRSSLPVIADVSRCRQMSLQHWPGQELHRAVRASPRRSFAFVGAAFAIAAAPAGTSFAVPR
jgi:hypothetical protein